MNKPLVSIVLPNTIVVNNFSILNKRHAEYFVISRKGHMGLLLA